MASASTHEERCDYTRVNRLLIDVGGDMMRRELENHIKCSDLRKTIKYSGNNIVLGKAKLFKDQIDRVEKEGNYGALDISFVYTLLRNLCHSIDEPAGEWDKLRKTMASGELRPLTPLSKVPFPDPSEQNLGDDIKRIQLIRNDIDHAPAASLRKQDFNFYWYILGDVCQRMDTRHGNLSKTYKTIWNIIQAFPMDDMSVCEEIGNFFLFSYINRLT